MKSVRDLIDVQAGKHTEKPFLYAPEIKKQMSYADLQHHCQQIESMLDNLEIKRGAKVALLMPNGYWTAALFLGVMYAGRTIVPLNAVSGDAALAYVLQHSDTKLLIIDPDIQEKYKAVLSDLPDSVRSIQVSANNGFRSQLPDSLSTSKIGVQVDDVALLIYTSGTTGKPKGVLLTHKNVIAGGSNTVLAHRLGEKDCALCVLPLYHINAEMVTIMAPLVSGGSVVLPNKFSTSNFWQLLAEYQCSWFSVVPTIIAYLVEQAEREGFSAESLGGLSKLRMGRSASAPLAPEIHRRFEALFHVPIVETMGLSETAAQILSNPLPPEKPKYGSPGRPVGNEAKIIDEQGDTCPPGVSGELMIRGDNVTIGYYKNPEATRDTLEPDGWLHTGDVALCDEDGFYFITGRIKELIIKGGENIAPREIDEALYEHPSVLEAAGFAVPDVHYGQEVMACVALKPGAECSEQELTELLRGNLGKFKAPKRIFFMNELPKGPSGKIQRLKLPDLIAEL